MQSRPRRKKPNRGGCRRPGPHPLVGPGNPADSNPAGKTAHPARAHHRLGTLETRPPSRRSSSPPSEIATVMLGFRHPARGLIVPVRPAAEARNSPMLNVFICENGKLCRQAGPCDPEALAKAGWIDLWEPTEEEARLVAAATGVQIASRAELDEIE